jgi:hypothetical protein
MEFISIAESEKIKTAPEKGFNDEGNINFSAMGKKS